MYFQVSFPCDFDLIYFDECQVFFCFLRLVFFLFYSWVGLYYRCGLEVSLSVWSSPDLYLVCMIEFHIFFPCEQASFTHVSVSLTYVYVSIPGDFDLSHVRLTDFCIFFWDECVYVCVHMYTSLLRIFWCLWYPYSIRVSKKNSFC